MSHNKHNEEKPVEENESSKEIAAENLEEQENVSPNWEEKFNEMANKFAEMEDRYKRVYSEFDNFKRRTTKEKVDYIALANAEIIKALLPVLDDLDRAFASESKNSENFYEGISLIKNKFHKTMENFGLQAIDSSGKFFDVELHEAITNFSVEKEEDKGKVIETILKGYFLKDKVLRFAQVVVGQ